jgi:hypothetical protein
MQIGTCRRATIKNIAAVFTKRGCNPGPVDEAQSNKLRSCMLAVIGAVSKSLFVRLIEARTTRPFYT